MEALGGRQGIQEPVEGCLRESRTRHTKIGQSRDAWLAQSIEQAPLGPEFKPHIGCRTSFKRKKDRTQQSLNFFRLSKGPPALYVHPKQKWKGRIGRIRRRAGVQIDTSCFALWKEGLPTMLDLQCSAFPPY